MTATPEWTESHTAAYHALQKAATRIGIRDYNRALRQHAKRGRAYSTFRLGAITEEHAKVIDALKKLGTEYTPEQAMAVLHDYGVYAARTALEEKELTWYEAKYGK